MNTEFPSRIPTVRNSTANTVASSTSTTTDSQDTSSFQRQVISVLKETMGLLDNITDKVGSIFNKTTKTQADNTKKDNYTKESAHSQVPSVVTGIANELQNLTNIVSDFFDKKIFHPFRKNEDSAKDDSDKEDRRSFRRLVKDGISNLTTSWKAQMKSLQQTVESVTDSIGSAVGSVFGRGIFGNLITKIINKALSFAVSKVLVGMALTNLPMTLIGGAIIAAIYLVVKYAEQIWDAIKWLGWSIDQGLDYIASIFRKSKYEEARKNLAKESGLTEEDILAHYGDTVRGRNQAYEDWERAKKDPKIMQDLIAELKKEHADFGLKQSKTYESLKYSGVPITNMTSFTTINNGYNDGFSDVDTAALTVKTDDNIWGMQSPIINTVSNNNSVNLNSILGNNVSNVLPGLSLSPYNTDINLNMSSLRSNLY